MKIIIMFLVFAWLIGCIWAFDYAHVKLYNYRQVSPLEFVLLISMSLMSWFTLLGLFVGNYLKKDEKNK